jgi:antitoxin VapB
MSPARRLELWSVLRSGIVGYTYGISKQEDTEMARTALFTTNRSQAVRLSKDVAFPPDVREVTVMRDGARRIITPANATWDDFFASPGTDLGERDQPPLQVRDAL